MTDFKTYLEQLLHKHKVHVEKRHLKLFDNFLNDDAILELFKTIQNTQNNMVSKWKEKTKVEDIKSKQIALPNGTVNKSYEFVFDFVQLQLPEVGDYDLEFDKKIGIDFIKNENKISGVLKQSGEHILNFNFRLKKEKEINSVYTKELKLIVNPDPKSLWIEKPSDETDKYWKKDVDSAHLKIVTRSLVIASKRGRSHAQEGIFRDDDFGYSFFEDSGWGVICVADGAGSAKFSRKGSLIACDEIISYFKNIDKEKLKEIESAIKENFENPTEENQKKLSSYFIEQLGKAAFIAQAKIKEEAANNNAVIKDYSTTLIFALIKKYNDKLVIASFWVGDGGIGIYSKEKNEVIVLGTPDSGEFAGQTRFLTMNDIFADGAYANRIRFKIVDDFTCLILMTDGITDPKFQTDANLNKIEKWDDLWNDLNGKNQDDCKIDFTKSLHEVESQLMTWLDFWSPGNHDDRTIAILY